MVVLSVGKHNVPKQEFKMCFFIVIGDGVENVTVFIQEISFLRVVISFGIGR